MALQSRVIALQEKDASPVGLLRRLGDLAWFLSHCIAVAAITAVGAVVALAAVIVFCLAAPAVGLAFFAAMHRRDARLRAAAPALTS